jgi:hypothetical protein
MGRRLAVLAADEVLVDADAPDIPVGIDGKRSRQCGWRGLAWL